MGYVRTEALVAIAIVVEATQRFFDPVEVHAPVMLTVAALCLGVNVADDPAGHTRILDEVRTRMEARGIGRVTFQLETRALHQIPKREERP